MALGDEDLGWLLQERGVPVALGEDSTFGIERRFTEDMLRDTDGPEFMSRALVVTVKTGSLSALESGADITVNGVPYVVRRYSQAEHGNLTRITCVRVA